MKSKVSKDLVLHRLEQAKQELKDAELLYKHKSYLSANNRAYYSIFHSIRAILAMEPVDFKKHKDVVAYFNKNYIKTEIFPRDIGKKIVEANKIREDSDYDDEFIVKAEDTKNQIDTAKTLIKLTEEYIKNNEKES